MKSNGDLIVGFLEPEYRFITSTRSAVTDDESRRLLFSFTGCPSKRRSSYRNISPSPRAGAWTSWRRLQPGSPWKAILAARVYREKAPQTSSVRLFVARGQRRPPGEEHLFPATDTD